ncbi:hypothetical protein CCACVL1_18646 [Corchorus capsularis]|uniref:Uncharacterized protein n=1 Tax=Corchorus capsularis TaxID=210143 RepID=A0A1R3HKM0_COCAP|nr:hypothetical protein CCACVL1_18646 [Corchorus capsularis]
MATEVIPIEKWNLVTLRNEQEEVAARAVWAPSEPSEIDQPNLRREIEEEARIRKDRAESVFMEQVIALLSQVDIETRRDVKKKILVTLRYKAKRLEAENKKPDFYR